MISTTEYATGRNLTLADIESLAKDFSEHHGQLKLAVSELQAMLEEVKRKNLPYISRLIEGAAYSKLDLIAAIQDAPGLFKKPKTQIFHGIKVGLAKGRGKMEIADEAAALKKLEALFPDEAQRGMYLHVEVSLNKETLAELPASDLKRLGITITAASDAVVIKPMDGEVEKIVAALLKEVVS